MRSMTRHKIRGRLAIAIVAGFLLFWPGLSASCSTSPCLDNASRAFPAVVRIVAGDKMGSGVIVHKSGYVLTSWHVVGAEKSAYVTLNSRVEYNGSVVATDQARDLALIRITGGNGEFACANLGSSAESDGLQTGDSIAIAGYPAYTDSVSPTVSRGILCAFPTIESVRFIQASAQVYPGSSGGPMLNCFGEVIGIVNGKYTNMGTGCTTFATAIDEAAGLMLLVNGSGSAAGSPASAPAAQQSTASRTCPNVGCKAPGFTLTGLDGRPVSLDSFKGRKVILVFAGTSCSGCIKLMQCISQVYDTWPREQLEVLVVVSGESDSVIRKWASVNGVKCRVLSDPNGQVKDLYRPAGVPAMYFINTYGEIKVKRAGPLDNCAAGIDSLLKLY
jgi:peroxiredoxin